MQKADVSRFDPDGAGSEDAGIFGLNFSAEESNLILIPIPWEATTSYGRGTARGPKAILKASPQLDLFDAELAALGLGRPWEFGIYMDVPSRTIRKANRLASQLALPIIARGGRIERSKRLQRALQQVNRLSDQLNQEVYQSVQKWRSQGKVVGLVGGDHSTPYGAIRALKESYPDLGILQIDAHADLRVAYEGFVHSHASIMYNVVTDLQPTRLVQVGVRDFCDSEYALATTHPQIRSFFDWQLKERLFQGQPWATLVDEIVAELPHHVYVSFDIDGLEPWLCPHTGTPVAGGLHFHEANYLLKALVTSGRKLVGFDLNEVAPGPNRDQWNGNVGARILYRLCGLALLSAGAQN